MTRWRPAHLPIVDLFAIALSAGPRSTAASSITSQVLIEPTGEFTGEVFGCSVV